MTKENRDLLIKDLCCRIPYNVQVCVNGKIKFINTLCSIDIDGYCEINNNVYRLEYINPCLFPMSSMTEEQKKEYISYCFNQPFLQEEEIPNLGSVPLCIDWLNQNHFDYRNLIEKGLAIDATELNIY